MDFIFGDGSTFSDNRDTEINEMKKDFEKRYNELNRKTSDKKNKDAYVNGSGNPETKIPYHPYPPYPPPQPSPCGSNWWSTLSIILGIIIVVLLIISISRATKYTREYEQNEEHDNEESCGC